MNPLTLAGLLALPDNGGLAVVRPREAEPDQLPSVWDGIVWSLDARDLTAVPGGLAILGVEPPSEPWQQDALIRRVHDLGFTGLALPRGHRLGEGTRRLGQRLGLQLMAVEDSLTLARACWHLSEGKDALTLDYVRKVARSIAYPADNLADLLRHLSSGLGHGVALVDAEGVLASAGGYVAPELLRAMDFAPWLDFVTDPPFTAASVRVDSASRTGLRFVIFGQGMERAHLAALGVAAEVAMPAVAARLLIDEVADVNDVAVASGLLREFLESPGRIEDDLSRRMIERGWRTGGVHLGFRIIGRGRIDALALLRVVKAELSGLAIDSHATTSGGGVSGWLTFGAEPPPPELERWVAALRGLHAILQRRFNIATGVGTLESGGVGLAATIDEAGDAARIAVNRSATGHFVRVDTLGLEQLLLAWSEADTFIPAARALLAPLLEPGSELLATVSAYLNHESAVAPTAHALGLHRNTVAQRIARAQELLGLDLANPETRLAVQLACRALSTRAEGKE